MHQVKIFRGVENEVAALEKQINAWLAAEAVKVINIIGNISPVVTVSLAIGVLGEAFTVWHAAGTALVLVGVVLFGRKQKPKAEIEATAVEP